MLLSCSSGAICVAKTPARVGQVLLCAGLDAAAQKALTEGTSNGGGDHLHKLLKFLTVRAERGGKREGIKCLGGPVDPAVDGDPADGCVAGPACSPRQRWQGIVHWGSCCSSLCQGARLRSVPPRTS